MPRTLRMPHINVFMTKEDECEFSRRLLKALPETAFIDIIPWAEAKPVIHSSISDCISEKNIGILNKTITPLQKYSLLITKTHSRNFIGACIGHGIIQYTRPKINPLEFGGLECGALDSTYRIDKEPDTDLFVNTVYNIFKKGAKKLYSINPVNGYINIGAEDNFFAWPDAIKKYDNVDCKYLFHNDISYFTSNRNAKFPENFIEVLKSRSS